MKLTKLLKRVDKPIKPVLNDLYISWEFKKMFSGGIVGAIKRIITFKEDSQVSLEYNTEKIAEILAKNEIYESKEAALEDMPNILTRKYHNYSWKAVVNHKRNETLYFLYEEYTDSD